MDLIIFYIQRTIDQIIEKYMIEGYDIIQILKEGPVDVIWMIKED